MITMIKIKIYATSFYVSNFYVNIYFYQCFFKLCADTTGTLVRDRVSNTFGRHMFKQFTIRIRRISICYASGD